MRKPQIGWALFFIAFCNWGLQAQEKDGEPEEELSKIEEKAYEAYEAQEYFFSIELLKDAYTEVRGRDKKSSILFKTGEAYRMMNEYKDAERYYDKAIKVGYDDNYAIMLKGDMLKAQGEYEDAIEAYQQFKKEEPEDKRADVAIESTRKAIKWQDEPSQYQVDNMEDINSKAMDFGVIYGGKRRDNNTIIFVSAREESEGKGEDGWIGQSFMDLYTSTAERKSRRRRRGGDEEEEISYADLRWSTPVPVDSEGILNSEHHEGTATFDSRKKTLYFTRCKQEDNEKLGCLIFETEEVGRSWREPEQLVFGTDTFANVGHPFLAPDDERLYFVSDDFNTKGQHDIFMATYDRRAKSWSEPKNLGTTVNTEGREYHPVVHDDGYLYFASDGHPGMGGLDIFRVKLGEDGMPDGEVKNMKYPINTNYDDFHLIWEPGGDTKKGFVSSNRNQDKSDDIFAVYRTPKVFNLEGVVSDAKTGVPIPQATVKMDGSDGSSYSVTADEDGYYIFDDTKLDEGNTYKLTFEKKKYLSATGDATTIGHELGSFEYVPSAKYFIKRLKLNKELDPIEEPIVLPNVFFDLGKWDLRPEAMTALDSVVDIMNNNPRIVIELRSHTDYRDTDERNRVLSQKRADTCVRYLESKGVNPERMVPRGMGESEPFTVPENYDGYGAEQLEESVQLTERYIKSLSPEKQEIANQINRRTDVKVLRDDFIPEGGLEEAEGVDPRDVFEKKREEEMEPGEIYVLKKRQSFGRIARNFDMNIRELKDLNGGLRGVRPFEGLQLKVEKDGNYDVWDEQHHQIQRRGMSWRKLARKLDMDDDKLEELNEDVDEDMLQPGFWVRIKKK